MPSSKRTSMRLCGACLTLLLSVLLVIRVPVRSEEPLTLSVKQAGVHLYIQPDERSQAVAKLVEGDKLVPLASTLGKDESWYLVKTQQGAQGWVKSSEVQGNEKLKRTFTESLTTPSVASPSAPSTSATVSVEKATEVPIEVSGGIILVPVTVNGSLKSYMMMDTGATYTVVTPAMAKRLSLRLDPHAARVPLMTANGYITAPLAQLASLKVGQAEVRPLQVVVHNFSPPPGVAGLLGLNFLNRFHTTIDSKRQRLTLAPR